ncbi:MAG: hypothetical protein WC869_00425 [Phycisphaerae bacterium]|jgi:hypothetical protein
MTTLATKLARNEADLISAAAQGSEVFHSVIFQKLAALKLDVDDRQAIMDMLTEEREKTAAPGGFGIGHALALGSILAPMAISGAKWLANRGSYDEGWHNLQMTAPDVIQQDPARAKSIYDLLHSTAPNIATNPVVAADLMRQMTAMPMVDLGSVKTMSDVGKNMGAIQDQQYGAENQMFDPLDKYKGRSEAFHMLTGGKTASVKLAVRHIAKDGTPCVFDWSTPAMKEAGITDAFTSGFSGNGSTMDQANNATQMEQMAGGQSLLPLDAVVRELIAKEMELSQREQVLQQQEIQMQQAMQMQAQMGGMYQQQYGVDPATGMPTGQQPEAGAEQGEDQGGEQGQDPNAAPAGQDPNAAPAQDPNAAAAPAAPAAAPGQDPNAQPHVDPNQVAQDSGQGQPLPPPTDAGAAPASDPAAAAAAGAAPAGGSAAPPAQGEEGEDAEGADAGAVPPGAAPTDAGVPADPSVGAAPPADVGGTPQDALMAAGGAQPGAMGSQGMVATSDGLHLEIPLPSLHIHIKTADAKADLEPLEKERQEALTTFNDLFSDIFRP